MYQNEETREPIACPFCHEAENACPHLLAVIDRSCGSCDGGALFDRWDEFSDLLSEAFAPVLASGGPPPRHWLEEPDLSDLWDEAKNNRDPKEPDWIHIDGLILATLVSDLLDRCDAFSFFSGQLDGAMVGRDFVTDLHYAKQPDDTIDLALVRLKAMLEGRS